PQSSWPDGPARAVPNPTWVILSRNFGQARDFMPSISLFAAALDARLNRRHDGECRPLRYLRLSLTSILMLLLAATGAAAQLTPRLKNISCCNGEDRTTPDPQINGCTGLIDSGDESAATLVIAYNNRGNARAAKGEYDLAIKDYDEAI